MSDFNVGQQTIFVTLAGSQAQGTARASSDVDLRGVCIAPLEIRCSYRRSFEQFEFASDHEVWQEPFWSELHGRLKAHPVAGAGVAQGVECTVFDLAKFVRLCAAANPNTLEILFADPEDWLHQSEAWQQLYQQRHQFLSKKVQQTYLGYALAQLRRIKSHRAWLLSPPKAKPQRADFGLPEHSTLGADVRDQIERGVQERLRAWDLDQIEMSKVARLALQENMTTFWSDLLGCDEQDIDQRKLDLATARLDLPKETARVLQAERSYQSASKQWKAFQTWQRQRNPARAELEKRFGYDTKHGMHLIRLMRTGLEVLEHGELNVRRDDAADLLAIRDGALDYDQLLEQADSLKQRMEAALPDSALPRDVDHAALDRLLYQLLCYPKAP